MGGFSSSGTLLQSFLSHHVNKCLLASSSKQAFQGKIHPDGDQTKGGASDCSKQVFKPTKLFSAAFLADDAFFAVAHDTDRISCFCWLKFQNPIGSLNPIKRFIFSDVLFKFFTISEFCLLFLSSWLSPSCYLYVAPRNDISTACSTYLVQNTTHVIFVHVSHTKLYSSCTAWQWQRQI